MYLNAPTASSKEVFQYFKDRPRPLAKGSDWLDKDLVQRCEELVEQRLTSKDALTKKNGTPVSWIINDHGSFVIWMKVLVIQREISALLHTDGHPKHIALDEWRKSCLSWGKYQPFQPRLYIGKWTFYYRLYIFVSFWTVYSGSNRVLFDVLDWCRWQMVPR